MTQIDLSPREYRLKGAELVRYLSVRPFKHAATVTGIWAGGVWSAQTYLRLEPAWPYLIVAFAPIVGVFVIWNLLRGGDSVEPPEELADPPLERQGHGRQR